MSEANNRIATDETLQSILAAIQAIAPGLVTTTQRGFLAPAAFIEDGMIKDASGSNKGLMTIQQVLDLAEVRARPHNHSYDGRNLKTIFGDAATFAAAWRNGDFSKIQNGDYWPLTISGSFKDYATDSTKTLTNAVFKMEFAINPYWKYGDSGNLTNGIPHLLACSRDLLPFNIQFRSANTTWYDSSTNQPWTGSHLFQSFNNASDGLVKLIQASELGPYLYTGPNGKGMRHLMETKGPSANDATNWGWVDRGILFLPSEKEVWGNNTWSGNGYAGPAALQWPFFIGSRRHIIKGLGDGGSRSNWWCGSSVAGGTSNIAYVSNTGHPSYYGAAYTGISAPLCFLLA